MKPVKINGEVAFTPKSEEVLDVMQMLTGKPRIDGECVFDSDGEGVHNLDFDSRHDGYKGEYEISGMCITCQDGVFG